VDSTAVLLHPGAPKKTEAPRPMALLTPTLDALMIGGASLLLFAVAYLFIDKNGSTNQISWAAFYLAFAVNNPHFMASYQLLYWDKRQELLANKRFLWAAVIAPALILGYMLAAVYAGSPRYLSYAVNFMFFTVGWHYIKQIYGTIVVTSARRGYYFTKNEALALKLSLFPVWFMSFINGNLGVREVMHYGVGYHTLALPAWTLAVDYWLAGASLALLGYVLFRKWVREGKAPGFTALVSFAAIYCWYLPTLYHAPFWYMIPFFHSLQYLLFVATLKKNQYLAAAAQASPDPAARREYFAKACLGFAAVAAITALATFKVFPEYLDEWISYDRKLFGSELFMMLFITFINIHHYFIDNVIWRRDNPALKQYLTAA
jgi:hypothetical protein